MSEERVTTNAVREARRSLAALLLELPEEVWREHKGVFENAVEALVEERARAVAEVEKHRKRADDAEACIAGAFEEHAAALAERDAALARERRLREAIRRVLDDEESRPGAWGPDVTCVAVLRAALAGTPEGFVPDYAALDSDDDPVVP